MASNKVAIFRQMVYFYSKHRIKILTMIKKVKIDFIQNYIQEGTFRLKNMKCFTKKYQKK